MYFEYLHDREWHKSLKSAIAHTPRRDMEASDQTAYALPDASGRFRFRIREYSPRDDWPILAISWNDATDYCKWLTDRQGRGLWRFELPSEDEW